MSEWLDLMLEEIARKQREAEETREEATRREQAAQEQSSHDKHASTAAAQSK